MLIYQLHEVIQDTIDNLTDINHDKNKTEILSHSIKILSETVDSEKFLYANTMIIQAEATNVSTKRLNKLTKMPQEQRHEAEQKIVKVKEKI